MPKFNYYGLSMREKEEMLKMLAKQEISLLIIANIALGAMSLGIFVTLFLTNLPSFVWVSLFLFALFWILFLLVKDATYLKQWYDIESGKYQYYCVPIEQYFPDKNCYKVTFSIQGKNYESFTKVTNGKRIHVFLYKNKIFSKVEME